MLPRRFWVLAVAFIIGGAGCRCDNANFVAPLGPRIELDTSRLVFDDTWVGLSSDRPLVVHNRGGAPGEVQLEVAEGPFTVATSATFSLEGGEQHTALLRFTPLNAGPAAATLNVASENGRLPVALSARGVTQPNCDDANECTDDIVDPTSGDCIHLFHERACATDNACLVGAQCAQGACVGQFLECDTDSPCKMALCDAREGCVEVDLDGACDTGNPCIEGTCTAAGCVTEPAVDLTPCGPFVPCVSASVCQAGTCVDVDIPDGSPCSDGNLCTADICADGACVGTYTPGEPEIVHQELHLAGRRSWPTARPDGSVLFYDPPGTFGVMWGGGMIRTLSNVLTGASAANWRVSTEAEAPSISGLHGLGGNSQSEWLTVSLQGAVRQFARLQPNGGIATFDISEVVNDVVLWGDYAYGCPQSGEANVLIYSMESGQPSLIDRIETGILCTELVIDAVNQKLIVNGASDNGDVSLSVYTLEDPFSPLFLSRVVRSSATNMTAGDGFVAVVNEVGDNGSFIDILDGVTLGQRFQHLPPPGLPFIGPPTVADGYIYARSGSEAYDLNALLYRRPINGGSPWVSIPEARSRQLNASPVLRQGPLLVVPAFGETGTLLLEFEDGPDSPLRAIDLNHSRGGVFSEVGGKLAMVGTDWLSVIDTADADAPTWDPVASFDKLLNPAFLRREGSGALGVYLPVMHQWRAAAATLQFETKSQVVRGQRIDVAGALPTLTLDASFNLTMGATAQPARPTPFSPEAPLLRAGSRADSLVVTVSSVGDPLGTDAAPGPLVFSVYSLSDAPASPNGTWTAVGELTLVDEVPLRTSLVPIAADGNRAAVYAPAPDRTLFLIDLSTPTAPAVLATYTYPELEVATALAVSGDRILALGGNTARILTRLGGALLAPETGFFTGSPANILSFDGQRALLSGSSSLLYYDFTVALTPEYNIDLGEKPLHLIDVRGRLYVSTEHGLHVISPPCPAP